MADAARPVWVDDELFPFESRADHLLATTNVRPMEMKGRAIQGWLHVDGDDLRTERQQAQWIAVGTATARNAPAKRPIDDGRPRPQARSGPWRPGRC